MTASRSLAFPHAEEFDELIERFARITEPGDGVTRLAYTALEREAHGVFRDWMSDLGLRVRTDAAGNTIAELLPDPAEGDGRGAIGTGSHLDSVPRGGRFDGIAGVVAAMQVARAAVELEGRRRPWRFVVFAAEEGARFGQACNGSRVVARLTGIAELHALRDASGMSMYRAMREAGLDPAALDSAAWVPEEWSAFIELHIEQGSVLERRGIDVGVVDSISGSTRLQVTVLGEASHTGGTPMRERKDALVTASACVLEGNRIARDPQHRGTRVTVGRLTVDPGSITTIPGRVDFTVDIRDVDSERQRRTAEALVGAFRSIAGETGTELHCELMGDTSPVVLPSHLSDCLIAAAIEVGSSYRVMSSGASHDSQQINRIVPTGMIFVPSRDGRSHVPEEFTSAEQIREGTEVLWAAMRRLDRE